MGRFKYQGTISGKTTAHSFPRHNDAVGVQKSDMCTTAGKGDGVTQSAIAVALLHLSDRVSFCGRGSCREEKNSGSTTLAALMWLLFNDVENCLGGSRRIDCFWGRSEQEAFLGLKTSTSLTSTTKAYSLESFICIDVFTLEFNTHCKRVQILLCSWTSQFVGNSQKGGSMWRQS